MPEILKKVYHPNNENKVEKDFDSGQSYESIKPDILNDTSNSQNNNSEDSSNE